VLLAPPWVQCKHDAAALKWLFVPPERLSVWCRSCNQVWDETTVPNSVTQTLAALLDTGKFVLAPPRDAS
jgi:hypothetical protein